jgi:hypothetical protein
VDSIVRTTSPTTIVLDVLVPLHVTCQDLRELPNPFVQGTGRREWTRRPRHLDGRRKVTTSRHRRAAIAFPQGVEPECPPTGLIEERWWAEQALFAIDTSNGNSWRTLKEMVVRKSQVDFIMAPETKMFSKRAIGAATSAA